MKINRDELLAALKAFALTGSGVVTGMPGAGKSHLLAELVVQLFEAGLPAAMIRLDTLTIAGDSQLARQLGTPDDHWLDWLKKIPLPEGKPGVLVFDAFDALRNDTLRDGILQQIARAKKELPGWQVLVSVRSYDALRSPKLIELFPGAYQDDGIHCRKFEVPVLSQPELEAFLAGQPRLSELYDLANERLKEIFRIPFYLKLLELILSSTAVSAGALSVIRSEIELLDMYWTKVVFRIPPAIATEKLLRRLTNDMVAQRRLAIDKYDLYDGLTSEDVLITDRLLSEHVLAEQGGTQIAYAHNILFDYAVSRLIIRGPAARMSAFIAEDPARPFFLRPSFVYFFTRLWYTDREAFWNLYHQLAASADAGIQLFNKLVPAAVIVREMADADDTGPLFEGAAPAETVIRDLLQGFRFLDSPVSLGARAALLERISRDLQAVFIGDFSLVLNKLLEEAIRAGDTDALALGGQAARAVFDFALANRATPGFNSGMLLAYHAIPMVSKTFTTEPAASRERLDGILSTIGTEGYDITCINQLIDGLKFYAAADAEFTEKVYRSVFAHQETDNSATTMMRSVMMSFSSNRRDDFEMCRFRLTEFFPAYLKLAPARAIPLALQLCNDLVGRRNGEGILIPAGLPFGQEMELTGIRAYYQPDMSHFWFDHQFRQKELEMVDDVFSYLNELLQAGEEEKARGLLLIYTANARTAKCWEMLLAWAAAHPAVFPELWTGLLAQPPILFWADTVVAAGALIEMLWPALDQGQQLHLEDTILGLEAGMPAELRAKAAETIFRLLSRIPQNQLQRPAAQALFRDRPAAANAPLVEFQSFSTPYTTRMHVADQGVDVTAPEVDPLLSLEQELDQFEHQAGQVTPEPEEWTAMLVRALDGFDQLQGNTALPEEVRSPVLTRIASVIGATLDFDLRTRGFVETGPRDHARIAEVLRFCTALTTKTDINAQANFSPGGIHNPTPKSQAAGALNTLFALTGEEPLLPLIEQMSADPNPIARFRVIRNIGLLYDAQPQVFWRILNARLAQEPDAFTLGQVIARLNRDPIYRGEQQQLTAALQVAKSRLLANPVKGQVLENFFSICLSFYWGTGHQAPKELIAEVLDRDLALAEQLIFDMFKIIEPENFFRNFKDPADVEKSTRLIGLLSELLEKCAQILEAAKEATEPDEQVKACFMIMDQIVQRIYFSLQINERLNRVHQHNRTRLMITPEQRDAFYALTKPLLTQVMAIADSIRIMQPHTAHYLIELLGAVIPTDTVYALPAIRKATEQAAVAGYANDNMAVREAIKISQRLLADQRQLLNGPAFNDIMAILQVYAQAGWPEAMQLLWQLDEIFR